MARSPPSEDYTETISQPHHTDQAVLDTHQLLYISLVDRSLWLSLPRITTRKENEASVVIALLSQQRRDRQAEALRSVDCAGRMPWARYEVVIDHADCLHECVAHCWARPLEPHCLEFPGHRVSFWRSRRDI